MNTINPAQELDQEVGRRLRQARKAKSLSQTQLGQAIGVTFQQIQKYERGTNRVSSSALVLIARALDVSPGHLLDDMANVNSAAPEWRGPNHDLSRDHNGETLIKAWSKLSVGDRRLLATLAKEFAARPGQDLAA